MSKRVTSRFNKFIIMVIMIIAGISYSEIAGATPPKSKVSKSAYRTSQSSSTKACQMLHKKRTKSQNMIVSVKRAKVKPMAETDSYMSVASSN